MSQENYYTIKSHIELKFKSIYNRDISYISFLPELNKIKSKRTKVKIEKLDDTIIFFVESADITAFRATMSDIISYGKIIENTLKLCE